MSQSSTPTAVKICLFLQSFARIKENKLEVTAQALKVTKILIKLKKF